MNRHLSDDELGEVVLGGPAKLAEHSDDFLHQHIVHQLCPTCIVRLIDLMFVYRVTSSATKH